MADHKYRTRLTARLRATIAAALAGAFIVCAAVTPQVTEASWTDAEAATGTVGAMTVPSASSAGPAPHCSWDVVVVVATALNISWTPPSGYKSTDMVFTVGNGKMTVPVAGGVTTLTGGYYTTKFSIGVLTNLLTNLLGGPIILTVYTNDHGWRSTPVTFTFQTTLAGLVTGCAASP